MMIIAGGEPELCCRQHAKREGGVYARPYALHVRKSCPECSVHLLCLCRKVWKRACVKWLVKKTDVRETQGCMATPTRNRKYEEVRWSLALSSLTVRCVGVSAFRFPIIGVLSFVAITTAHCAVDMSVAWRRGSVGTCNLSVSREWDGHGQSVGRSVNACGPIDHTSMGLAQAHPNQKCTQDFKVKVNINAKHENFFPVIISHYIFAMCFVRRFENLMKLANQVDNLRGMIGTSQRRVEAEISDMCAVPISATWMT